jgi:hypothetical protein
MPTLYNADLKPLQPGDYTHPYDHATKLFVADNFRLAPKQSFLYYVIINIDPSQTSLGGGLLGDITTLADRYQNLENGMLVKRTDLPRFTMGTKTLNAYNRKNIVQTNISYDPINVTFHDDAADVITNFWNDYYTYYFRDSDYNEEAYRQEHKYFPRNKIGWGYSPANGGISTTQRQITSFIKDIRIYSLHNKRFTEYRLINPVITSWRHGEHDYSNSGGVMENTMSVAYETVKYYTGYVNPVDVSGFSLLHYDNFNSPISTSVTNIYSDAGILGALTNGKRDLAKPQGAGGAGGPLSNLLSMYRAYNNLKNVNLQTVAGTVIGQVGAQILNNGVNSALNYVFPTVGSGISGTGSTQVVAQNIPGNFNYASSGFNSSLSVLGSPAAYVQGAAINASNQFLYQTTAGINRGIAGFGTTQIPTPGSTMVYDVLGGRTNIVVDPKTQQPVTGTITAIITNEAGVQISSIQTVGTQTGTYNPANPLENLASVQTVKDQSDNYITINTYRDGTRITEDADGNRISYVPGAYTGSSNINTNPIDTRTKAADGYSTAGVQYYTNPSTGIRYTVGGTTSAQITNTLSGAAGGVAGLYAGQSVNAALSGVLGTSVVGRTLNAAISTATGAAVGRAVNNGLQPIVNNISGQIVQGWDSVSGSIKNVLSTWSGSGGFDPSNPKSNIVSSNIFDDGSQIFTYKDGTTRTLDSDGTESITKGTNNSGITDWFNGASGQNSDSAAVTPPPGTIWTDGSGTPIYTGFGDYAYQGGDTTLSPIALTNEQWDTQNAEDQTALDAWANDSTLAGNDSAPFTPPDDLNDFGG